MTQTEPKIPLRMGLEFPRICEAYLMMAEIGYRPQAPSNGFGGIRLSESELRDVLRLRREAMEYASKFIAEEDGQTFMIGLSDFASNRAMVFLIEAARLCCCGMGAEKWAYALLMLAQDELRPLISREDPFNEGKPRRPRGMVRSTKALKAATTKGAL
jgi:hypothetical protein